MFTIQTEIPLPVSPPARYIGIAYDGISFYFTKRCECKIYQYGPCFQLERCFDTCKSYTNICFDPKEHCFWASSDQCRAVIFKLNSCFQEVDCIRIIVPDYCGEPAIITGISYNCCCDKLIVSFASHLVSVDKCDQEKNTLLVKATGEWILGTLSVCPYIICLCMTGTRQIIKIFSSDGKFLKEFRLSCDDIIESAVFVPTQNSPEHPHLTVLVSRHHCYSYVWSCVLPCEVLEYPICPCNYWKCDNQLSCCRKDCYTDVLESAAQLETAISRVLAAKGDKIKDLLECSNDPHEILKANQSVQATLVHASHLEYAIYDILASLEETCEKGY